MQSSSSTTFEELVQCSVCLERYTNPKMLPCQHTYCCSCLLRLCKGRSNVTCPQCREVHDIPKDGVAHFKDSLLAKELLSTLMAKEQCCDCQEKVAVSLCEHCDTQLCVQCLVQHTRLSSEISSSLGELNDDLVSEESKRRVDGKKLELEEFVNDLKKEIVRVKGIFDEAIQKLVTRRNLFANFMEVIVRIYGDVLNLSGDSYIADLSAKLLDRKTTNSLKEFKNNLVDLKTVTRLIQKRSDQFKFAGDANTIQKLESFGHVEFGQAVIDIKGTYVFHQGDVHENVDHLGQERNIPSSVVKTTKDVQTWTDIQPEDGAVVSGVNTSRTATSDVSTSTAEIWPETESSRNDATGAEHDSNKEQEPANVACLDGAASLPVLRRDPTPPTGDKPNQLPINVNYTEKGTGGETVVGQGEFADDHQRLYSPFSCCYHVTNDEIYVADHDNNRIMIYDSKGRNGRVFFSDIEEPTDVAISDDGELVFLLQETVLNIVSVSGKLVRTINSFPLGNLEKCYAVCIHNQHVVVLDSGHRCVIVYNDRGDYVRHFGSRYLSDARSMTVAGNGDVYVTDGIFSCVYVFKLNGECLETFGRLDGDIDGVSVDGDGYVCVSRALSNRIDVYDPQRTLMTSFGERGERPGCLDGPYGLCLMPDGRLIVTDNDNNRLQIF